MRASRIAFLLSAVCVYTSAAAASSSEETCNQIESFIHEGLPFFKTRVQISDLRKIDGIVSEKSYSSDSEYYEGKQDIYYYFEYSGMTVSAICIDDGKECMLDLVEVSSRDIVTKNGIKIGTPSKEISSKFGIARSISDDKWHYGCESSEVSFTMKDGHVTLVTWGFYTG